MGKQHKQAFAPEPADRVTGPGASQRRRERGAATELQAYGLSPVQATPLKSRTDSWCSFCGMPRGALIVGRTPCRLAVTQKRHVCAAVHVSKSSISLSQAPLEEAIESLAPTAASCSVFRRCVHTRGALPKQLHSVQLI